MCALIFIPFCPRAPHTGFFLKNFLLYLVTGMGAQSGALGMHRPKVCSVSYALQCLKYIFQCFYLRTGACEKESVFVV